MKLCLWFMCLQHLFPNMQKWSKVVSKRQRVTEKQSQWVFVHVAATPICFLLLLWQVFVRGFFTVLGWSTVIEHPHRAEQKPCSFIWTVFKTWNRPKFRKTSRNKTSASGESSAARILHRNEYFVTFLTLMPLLCVQVEVLYLYFNLMKTYKWLSDCSSGVTAWCLSCGSGFFNVFELLWGPLTAERFLYGAVTLWCTNIWKSDQAHRPP